MFRFKALVIIALVLGVSFLHLQTTHNQYNLHILHRELFFIPIIFAGFWFGMQWGLGTALLVCAIYTPLMITQGNHYLDHNLNLVLFTQLSMYLLVAALIGWLRDRQQEQQRKLLAGERATALARAASALSYEVQDIVASLDLIHSQTMKTNGTKEQLHFQQELERLNHLVEVLARYNPLDDQEALSTDLNTLLTASHKKLLGRFRKAGVELVLELDAAGCPSMIKSATLSRVVESLVENALEASTEGGKVRLRSRRGGTHCFLEVVDEGAGVAENDRTRLFTPFFTTKPGGSGLALAAGRKVLRDHGGDLIYVAGPVGATFRLIVPRENLQQNIDEFARDQGLVPPSRKGPN